MDQKRGATLITQDALIPGVIKERHLVAGAGANQGDLVYSNATGGFTNLPIGATGNLLWVNSGVPAWLTNGSSGQVLTITGGVPTWGTGSPNQTTLDKARAYLANNQSVASGSFTLITLDTKDFDTNTNFSLSTHLYTAPITGYYQIIGQVSFADGGMVSGKRIGSSLFVNGTSVAENIAYATGTGGMSSLASTIEKLTANDTVGLYGFQETGINANVTGLNRYTYLAIHLLST